VRPMDRATLEQRLRAAKAHVALGDDHIERQREVVSALKKDGKDATAAQTLLNTFRGLQEIHVANMLRLTDELAKLPK